MFFMPGSRDFHIFSVGLSGAFLNQKNIQWGCQDTQADFQVFFNKKIEEEHRVSVKWCYFNRTEQVVIIIM